MPSEPESLRQNPETRIARVEDLVAMVLGGRIRVPEFQRALRWRNEDVVRLFDSLFRGYPVGSLVFYLAPAHAGTQAFGPILVHLGEESRAWWVVDGQQRLTSLAVALSRDLPFPPAQYRNDPYAVYFDAREQRFVSPPPAEPVPSTWVPLPALRSPSRLSEWIFRWQHRDDEGLRHALFEAGERIRDYPIPVYLVEAPAAEVAREIFLRVNQAGVPLTWPEVHDALFAGEGPAPSTLAELTERLVGVGMGRIEEDRLLALLIALRGKDPTKSLGMHLKSDRDVLRGAVAEALPVLRKALSFLRAEVGIPHLLLIPRSISLEVLVRFFARHSDPSPRTRLLLVRWFWRTAFGASGPLPPLILRRRGIEAVCDDEEESVQALLRLLVHGGPRAPELPGSFDARSVESRIAMLALAGLKPRNVHDAELLDLPSLLETEGYAAFVKLVETGDLPLSRSAANRTFQSPQAAIHRLAPTLAIRDPGHPVLASHAISPEAARRLAAGDLGGFLAERARTLTAEIRRFAERKAEWDHSDRPSIEHILAEAGVTS